MQTKSLWKGFVSIRKPRTKFIDWNRDLQYISVLLPDYRGHKEDMFARDWFQPPTHAFVRYASLNKMIKIFVVVNYIC